MKAAAPNKLKQQIIKRGVYNGVPLVIISSQAMVKLDSVKVWAEHFCEKHGWDMPPETAEEFADTAKGRPGPNATDTPDPNGSSTPDPNATGTPGPATGTPKKGAPGTVNFT